MMLQIPTSKAAVITQRAISLFMKMVSSVAQTAVTLHCFTSLFTSRMVVFSATVAGCV